MATLKSKQSKTITFIIFFILLIGLNYWFLSQNTDMIFGVNNSDMFNTMQNNIKKTEQFSISDIKKIAQEHAIILNQEGECLKTGEISSVVLFRFLEQIQPILQQSKKLKLTEIERIDNIDNTDKSLNQLKICGF